MKIEEEEETAEEVSRCSKHLRVEAAPCGPQLHLPDCSFLERLDAVEEELAINSSSSCPSYQSLNEGVEEGDGGDADGGEDDTSGLVACRTRSKHPLRDVPLGQLEAELLAPDTTPDMYTPGPPLYKEDRHWSHWLQGLMASDNEEEADDEDDPEYNFLEDLDEPDQEDYRTDRAVRITKKEVNQLLEELFDTFQEEKLVVEEEEEAPSQTVAKFNVPQALRFEAPLANMLTECRRAVREQFDAQQQRRAVQVTPSRCPQSTPTPTLSRCPQSAPTPTLPRCPGAPTTLAPPLVLLAPTLRPARFLNHVQKCQLQQQIQQHVQLLTQVHLLSRCVEALHNETSITRQYLEELQQFSSRAEATGRRSSFRVSNLEEALHLLQEVEQIHVYPYLPADMAWLMATRRLFLYSELLPICSLDPQLHSPKTKTLYTPAEDCLLALGLRNFSETSDPHQMISSYLVLKKPWKLRRRVWEMRGTKAPASNPIKVFRESGGLPAMPLACGAVGPGEERPPVERETSSMPEWLKKSRPIIQKLRSSQASYPAWLPRDTQLRLHPSRPTTVTKLHPDSHSHLTPKRLFSSAPSTRLPPIAIANAQSISQPPSMSTPPLLAIRPSAPVQQETPPSLLTTTPSVLATTPSVPATPPSVPATPPLMLEEHGGNMKEWERRTMEEERRHMKEEERRNNNNNNNNNKEGEEEEEKRGMREEERRSMVEERRQEEVMMGRVEDEDEEEEMSSEESILSVPELQESNDMSALFFPQETMKQLTWLASERRLGGEDSEEDHSPGSQNSQEEISEEEEEGLVKGEEEDAGGDRCSQATGGGAPGGGRLPRRTGKTLGRGRGRIRPPTRRRQERHSKDSSKLLLLYDHHILDNDPQRESKDTAFAQAYLTRVREALGGSPKKMEEFLSLLYEFEEAGEEQGSMVHLYRSLRCILQDNMDLLRDFAAFLQPEQALECGLFEEQQAFQRSRRFLRQLEISFGENPSHYQKIIKALQGGDDLSQASIQEDSSKMLIGQRKEEVRLMATSDGISKTMKALEPLFPARHKDGGDKEGGDDGGDKEGGDDGGDKEGGEDGGEKGPETEGGDKGPETEGENKQGGDDEEEGGDEEEEEEEEEGGNDGGDDNLEDKDPETEGGNEQREDKDEEEGGDEKGEDNEEEEEGGKEGGDEGAAVDCGASSAVPGPSAASWTCIKVVSVSLVDEEEDEKEEDEEREDKHSDGERSRTDDPSLAKPSPSPETAVCAKNMSLTASGEKVILWTREADRVLLTTCQQEGANQNTFQAISTLLGNKTPSQVSRRFRDLMKLFRTAARQADSEEEAPPSELAAANEEEGPE
ncbi:hypothetical protein CRUP_019593 [Coryphaenoides rupestris]|nr:hypothetical protein CRUP_019593 [Coryphaenoides rupestris]